MICKELIEYLSQFKPDEQISIVIVDTEKRLRYLPSVSYLINDAPLMVFDTTETESLDEDDFPINERKCRLCGCTQNNACPGGCYWVEDDLCSECAGGKAEMKYKCIQSFSVEKRDGDGFLIDNEYLEVKSGSLWETDNSINVIGGEVRLIALSENHFEWLEISRETLNLYFDLYKEDETIAGAQP